MNQGDSVSSTGKCGDVYQENHSHSLRQLLLLWLLPSSSQSSSHRVVDFLILPSPRANRATIQDGRRHHWRKLQAL